MYRSIRRISLLFHLFMALMIVPVMPVRAEEEVKVRVISEPAELSEAGDVLLTFEVSNYSDFELHEIKIALDDQEFLVEGMENCIIPPGGSATFPLIYSVPDAKIGLEQIFHVTWLRYGEPFIMEVPVTIMRAVEPVISIERTADSTFGKLGDTVTITYELSNDTKFDMTNITVIDEQISDNAIFRNHTLHAGGKITQSFVYTISEEAAVSAPIVTYDVNGKTKTFSAIEPLTISMAIVRLELKTDMGGAGAAGVPFEVSVTNSGNTTVSKIYVTDELSNPIAQPFDLEPKETANFSCLIVPVPTEPVRQVSFGLSATDVFGDTYTLVPADFYEVRPFVDASQITVTMMGETTIPWETQNGTVGVRISIENSSSVELKNAILSEATLGIIQTYDVLQAGTTVCEQMLTIGSPRNLTFALKATDPAGTERDLTGTMVAVAYPNNTPEPSPTVEPTREPILVAGSFGDSLVKVFMIVGIVLLIAFLALIILSVLEYRRSGGFKNEDWIEELDAGEMDSSDTAVFEMTPVRLEAPRESSDYVRIAEERRQNHLRTKRPILPLVVPEYDSGIPKNEDLGPYNSALEETTQWSVVKSETPSKPQTDADIAAEAEVPIPASTQSFSAPRHFSIKREAFVQAKQQHTVRRIDRVFEEEQGE